MQRLIPIIPVVGIFVVLFVIRMARGEWLWVGMLATVAFLLFAIWLFVKRTQGAWDRWKRVQLAGLIMLLCSSIAGCVVALVGPLGVWGRTGDFVVLVLMLVLLVVGALVICAGIVGSWLPEVRLRKRRGDSADLE